MRAFTVGSSLFAIGVFHNFVGLVVGSEYLLEMLQDGLVASVADDQPWRLAIFWFEAFGLLLMLLGASWHWAEARGLTIPRWAAVSFAGVGLVGVFFMPASGFWTILPVAAWAWLKGGNQLGAVGDGAAR